MPSCSAYILAEGYVYEQGEFPIIGVEISNNYHYLIFIIIHSCLIINIDILAKNSKFHLNYNSIKSLFMYLHHTKCINIRLFF